MTTQSGNPLFFALFFVLAAYSNTLAAPARPNSSSGDTPSMTTALKMPTVMLRASLAVASKLKSADKHGKLKTKGLPLNPFTADDEQRLWNEIVARGRCGVDWKATVDKQLVTWRGKGFSISQLDAYCDRGSIARVQVVGGELRYATWLKSLNGLPRFDSSLWLLMLTYERAKARGDLIPDTEMLFNLADNAQGHAGYQWDDPAPLMCNTKCDDASVSFPMTWHDQFGLDVTGEMALSLYKQRYELIKSWGNITWISKNDRMFFSSNENAEHRGYREVLYTLKSPHIEVVEETVPLQHYGRFRYLVYAYGHCGWSRRLHELALMNATILMEKSDCNEYVLDAFVPGVHYVPVAEDFSDIEERLDGMMADPIESERMAAAWVQRGTDGMSLHCTLDYIELLLREYAELQRDKPVKHRNWQLYEFSSGRDVMMHPPILTTCNKPPRGKHVPESVYKIMGQC